MTLKNALGDIALDASVQQVRAELDSIDTKTPSLESGRVPVAIASGSSTIAVGTRRDVDTTPVNDGETHSLFTNQFGRLKVSDQPAAIIATTGDITAIQSTVNTPVAGGTVQADISRASNVTLYCTGTFAAVNCTFEASIDGGTTWFGVTAARTNSNTAETTTGSLSAAPAYAWEMSVNAYTHVRVRATARTSGTQTWRILPGAYATEPAPVIQTHPVTGSGTFTVAGTTTNTPATPTTSAIESTNTVMLTSTKTSAGTLYYAWASNPTGSPAFLKLYNKASAPVVTTDTPVRTVPVPAGSDVGVLVGSLGVRMTTGIAWALTGAATKTDVTAAPAGVEIGLVYI
jgi:hypothetical protein